MRGNVLLRRFLPLLPALVLFFGPGDGFTLPPDVPIKKLIASPKTIRIEGRQLYLSTEIWRDFQPISPPDGWPLTAILSITSRETGKLPTSISTDAVWMVYKNQVWRSWFKNEPVAPDLLAPNRIVKIVRGGPKWGPHIHIDVIVRVNDSQGASRMLRAPNQWISRTD